MFMILQMFIRSTKTAFCQYFVMRSPYFFVLNFNELETILKKNQKYFEKSLQFSK